MKTVFFITLLLMQNALAKGGSADTVADYIVPVRPELVAYSRFKVDIVKPFKGVYTEEIAYTFPAELAGKPLLTVHLKPVSYDSATDVSIWESPEMTASCTTSSEKFICNIYVKKTPLIKAQGFMTSISLESFATPTPDVKEFNYVLNKASAVDFLNQTISDKNILQKQLDVLDSFLDSEPGGILSYEFEDTSK